MNSTPLGTGNSRAGWIALGATLVAGIGFTWPAYWNGYPLLFNDSGVYIGNSAGAPFHPDRAIGYALFLRGFSWGGTLWSVVLWQGLFTAALLGRVAWWLGGTRRALAVAVSAAVVVLASAGPRYGSYLMPDVFTAWLFLGAVLWLVSPSWLDRVAAGLVLVVAILVHNSHLPIALACAGGLLAVSALLRQRGQVTPAQLRRVAALGIVVLASLPAALAMNFAFTGRAVVLNSTSSYILAQFVETGVAGKTLDRYCAELDWELCRYREQVHAHTGTNEGWFLFGQDSPFRAQHSGGENPEYDDIVRHAFRCCLPEIVVATARGAFRQFFAIDSAHSLDEWHTRTSVRGAVTWYYKRDKLDVRTSHQARDEPVRAVLHPLPEGPLHVVLLLIAAGLGWDSWRRGDRTAVWLLVGLLGLLVVNALVSAFGSTLWPRYQGRIAWLLPYCVTLAGCRAWAARAQGSRRGIGSGGSGEAVAPGTPRG